MMCLAVPMKLVEINADNATGELDGVRYSVDLSLLEEPKLGDYVLVHAGFAIERIDENEASKTIDLFREMLQHEDS